LSSCSAFNIAIAFSIVKVLAIKYLAIPKSGDRLVDYAALVILLGGEGRYIDATGIVWAAKLCTQSEG
jgi:hypothetical protein